MHECTCTNSTSMSAAVSRKHVSVNIEGKLQPQKRGRTKLATLATNQLSNLSTAEIKKTFSFSFSITIHYDACTRGLNMQNTQTTPLKHVPMWPHSLRWNCLFLTKRHIFVKSNRVMTGTAVRGTSVLNPGSNLMASWAACGICELKLVPLLSLECESSDFE